jgi:hypothetical protein
MIQRLGGGGGFLSLFHLSTTSFQSSAGGSSPSSPLPLVAGTCGGVGKPWRRSTGSLISSPFGSAHVSVGANLEPRVLARAE